MTAAADELLGLLPEDGRRVPYDIAMTRARDELGLDEFARGAAAASLCTSQRAVVESLGGYWFVRRVCTSEAFPLRARPVSRAPRRARRAVPA